MKLGVLALVASVVAVIAPAALAAPGHHSRSAQVDSLDVDPATVVAGESTHVSVTLENPAETASPKRDLLIRLRAPTLVNAERNLARAPIGPIPAGGSKTLELDVAVPATVLAGDYPLVGCRAQDKSPNKCGAAKQATNLSVLTPADLALAPGSRDFGTHATGTTSAVQTFTLTNSGGAPTGVPAVATSGDVAQFPVSANTCTASLGAGESCSFGLAFSPTATGAKNAGVGVVAVPGGGASATLSGTGATPANLTISPSPKAFGSLATGNASPVQTFTVTNTGGVPSGTIATSVGGADPGQFAKSADGCNGQALGPGATCTVGGAFAPSALGAKSATLQATATPGGSASATLNGTGASPANLTISPSPHGFGTHATGTTSPVQTFTVTNTGGVPTGAIATSVGGADPGQFTKSADNCNGQTLGPGASCTVGGAFAPSALGAKSATLVATATPGGSAGAALNGTGASPANLSVSPTPHAFGTHVNNTTSAAQTFTVTNTGGVPSGTIATSVTGTDPTQFPTSADNCNGQTLAPGASCTVDGAFAPTTAGAKSASLEASATPGGTASASLTGTGQTPANLTMSPTSWDFGNVLQGTTSPKQFTVTNTGQQSASPSGVGLSGAKFSYGSTTCSGTLAGGDSCTIDISFAPGASDTGPFTGTLTLNATVGGSPSATLTGNAVSSPANLQISITPFGSPSPGTYSSSDTSTVNLPAGFSTSAKVWIRNSGAADAYISNSPVPLSTTNVSLQVFAPFSSTCNVEASDTHIAFSDLKIPGGGECYVAVRRTPDSVGPYSGSFSIAASPGGTISGTMDGNGT